MKLRHSIVHRLTRVNMLVSTAAVVLACAAFFVYGASRLRQQSASQLTVQSRIIAYESASPLIFNDPQSATTTLAALRTSPHIVYAGVYGRAGHLFASYRRSGVSAAGPAPRLPAALTRPQVSGRWFSSFTVVQPIAFGQQQLGFVLIRSDAAALVSQLRDFLLIFAIILFVALLLAYLLARGAQHRIAAPIMALAATADAVSRDHDFAVRAAPVATRDEIAALVTAFNAMLSEIQQRDASLQASELQFRTLADALPQLAWMAYADGSIFWYNQRWYDYTGTTAEQAAGWGWEFVQDPEHLSEVLRRWQEAIRTGERFEMVFPLRARDGSFRDFLTLAVPILDPSGQLVRWFGTNTDITRERQAEQALRRSEKLAATGRLAASVAHEINNPLAAITNLLYLARTHPHKAQGYVARASDEVDRVAEIAKSALGFYRDPSSPIPVDIAEVFRSVLALLQRRLQAKDIAVAERLAPGAIIVGLPGELRQIFVNLMSNAIDACAEHGSIAVKVSLRTDGVQASIMDNGCGIPAASMAKIFEPFYTTKESVGTGLGLWLTSNLVRNHHGEIRVKSWTQPHRSGTVFSVLLPAARHQASEDSPA